MFLHILWLFIYFFSINEIKGATSNFAMGGGKLLFCNGLGGGLAPSLEKIF